MIFALGGRKERGARPAVRSFGHPVACPAAGRNTLTPFREDTVDMEYVRINNIDDPLFTEMHRLMEKVFPGEEVLAFGLWAEPLKDPGIHVYVAVENGEVVGATEYRYYPGMGVAMTDFTIIGREGLGIGPFLVRRREEDLLRLVKECGGRLLGMFAEIYNPYLMEEHDFGGVKPMNPFVRREVLAHLGYRRVDVPYVHPSWNDDGTPVRELDLGFLTYEPGVDAISASLVHRFLSTYYTALGNKPQEWYAMMEGLQQERELALLPL